MSDIRSDNKLHAVGPLKFLPSSVIGPAVFANTALGEAKEKESYLIAPPLSALISPVHKSLNQDPPVQNQKSLPLND